ncbi:HAD-IC family P-type ATPase [Candidatus Nomurabacteria bacterium]|nr:HAD-IC family P-type ATPase [Candidatus Nomurabacteria bacterium]
MDWYNKTQENVIKELKSNITGLISGDVIERRIEYGENKLPEAKQPGYFEIFLNQFKSPLIYILLISVVIVLLMGDTESGIVIGIVLVLNSIIGTFQEGKAQNTLNALKKFVTTKARVQRDNIETIVDDYELVPGDIVVLVEGDKVPSDIRLISLDELKIDESALTGESDPVLKIIEPIDRNNLSPQDQKNMVFRGTYVVGGQAVGIVVATGSNTLIGKISVKLQSLDTDVPLKAQIKSLSKVLIIIVLFVVVFLFIIGIYSGISMTDMFSIAVAVAVSAIPEGLPVVVTLILATGVNRMTKRNALVKNLQAVEALGQADIIAVDKTGTITLNQMQVMEVYVASGLYNIGGQGYEPKGAIEQNGSIVNYIERPDLMLAGKISALTAIAHISYNEEKKMWQRVNGDPTEVALLVFSQKLSIDKQAEEKDNPKIHEIPFSSEYRYHATINNCKNKNTLFIAGAPELIIDSSVDIFTNDGKIAFSEERKKEILAKMKEMSDRGLRIIALATSDHSIKDKNFISIPKLTFVGIAGIEDAIRSEVYDSVQRAQKAGIKVVMITGDHIDTASAIARSVGIYKEGDNIITDKDFTNLNPKELSQKIVHTSVFARVTPDHKMAIINAYKNANLVIAMTGDGVNDALSLAAADLGVSMGKTGTEVAKEASDIVLLDDNFGSIVYAVEEGRNIYLTIKKVLMYLLSTGIGEIFAIGGFMLLGLEMPFTAAQIIWLNFVTDGFLVVALAFEPKDTTLISHKMNKKDQKLINTDMLIRMFIMGIVMMVGTILIFTYYKQLGVGLVQSTTIALTLLAVYQWFNAFNCRSDRKSIFSMNLFSNMHLIIAFICVIILQFVAVYNQWFNKFLDTTPIETSHWVTVVIVGLSVILFDEIYKLIKFGISKFR